MATQKEVLDRQKEVSERLSGLVRTLSVSILAIDWLLLVPGKDGQQSLPYSIHRWVFFATGAFALLALTLDFFQYRASYLAVRKALANPAKISRRGRKTYAYDYDDAYYRRMFAFFRGKQWALVVSGLGITISILVGLTGCPSLFVEKRPTSSISSQTPVGTVTMRPFLAPERIGSIDGFASGDASHVLSIDGVSLDAKELNEIAVIFSKLEKASADGSHATLLLVGSTDRRPLGGLKRAKFEGNLGLARARAETIKNALLSRCKSKIAACVIDQDRIISLISGPLHTAEVTQPQSGYGEDRRVDIWVLWTPRE
jgi:hypothetical protein